jgi:iron complex outermembrane receptor protein
MGAPTFRLEGLQVSVARPSTTGGGTSAVSLAMDSVGIRPAPTMENVLRDMPLIQIRRNSRGEAQPALRGGEDRQIAVLMDGVPLTLGWDARTDLSIIPLTAARTVRIVRGLSSVLMGPNVLGGAIEVDIASGPESLPAPRPFTAAFGLDHTGAARGQASAGVRVARNSGSWDLRGGLGFRDTDGFRVPEKLLDDPDLRLRYLTADEETRLNTDARRVDGFVSARYQRDSGAWMSLVGTGIQLERGVAPEAHVDDPRLWRYPDQRRLVAALSAGTGFRDTRLGRGDVEVSLGLDLGRTDIEAFESESYDEVLETERGKDRTLTLRTTGDLAVSDRTDLRGALTLGQVVHDEIIDGGPSTTYEQRLWSLGGEWERRFESLFGVPGLSGSRLTLGATADGSDTPRTGDKASLGRLWDWGGRVGLSTLAGGDVLLHGSVSRRTRFPALRELYSGALGRFEPNPDLRPEEMVAAELGFTLNRSPSPEGFGTGDLQVVAFVQRLNDGIVRTSVTDSLGNRKFKRVNQDQIRSRGIEVLAGVSLGPLSLNGDITLQRVRGLEPDGTEVRLEYEPAVAGKLTAQLPLFAEIVGVAGVNYLGEQLCENPEAGGLEEFSSSPRFDLGFLRRFLVGGGRTFRSLDASVRVDNLGDAGVFDQCGLPQPGRTFSLEFSVS